MRKLAWLFALLVACGSDDKAPPEGGQAPRAPGPAAAKPQAPKHDPAQLEALKKRKQELVERERSLERELEETLARHEKEAAGLPDKDHIRSLRKTFPQLRRDAVTSSVKIRKMQRRLEELKKFAEGDVAAELEKLHEERKAIETRLNEAGSGWEKARAEAAMGAVEESPVKRDLQMVRAIKQKWFEVTPAARRGKLRSSAKKNVNGSFRAWLDQKPPRKELCGRVLSQPVAPKGKTPDNYDFTDLDFFILLELLENELDKLNIAVEKKEAKENEAKYWAIESELDAVREKIALAMQKGGPELDEFLDLGARLETSQKLDSMIQSRYAGAREVVNQVREVQDRQRKEQDEAEAALEKVRKELADVRRKLARASG